jgi:hypothetical protein
VRKSAILLQCFQASPARASDKGLRAAISGGSRHETEF